MCVCVLVVDNSGCKTTNAITLKCFDFKWMFRTSISTQREAWLPIFIYKKKNTHTPLTLTNYSKPTKGESSTLSEQLIEEKSAQKEERERENTSEKKAAGLQMVLLFYRILLLIKTSHEYATLCHVASGWYKSMWESSSIVVNIFLFLYFSFLVAWRKCCEDGIDILSEHCVRVCVWTCEFASHSVTGIWFAENVSFHWQKECVYSRGNIPKMFAFL